MAAIRNARDLLLQAAPSRYSNPPNAHITLTASSSVFKIPSGGAPDPTGITFTYNLSELAGPASFAVTGGTLTVAGNVATLTYANMPGVTASVKAMLTENGQAYESNLCSVTKLADGTSGAGTPGADGARGAGQYFTPGSAWSDALADAATPGGNVPGDEVTISNGTTFIQVRQWNGSAWVVTVPIFDGGGIFPGSVTANKINANGLTIRTPAGAVILDAGGGGLQAGYEAPGTKNIDANFSPKTLWEFRGSLEGFTSGGMSTFAAGADTLTAIASAADSTIYSPTISVVGGVHDKIRMRIKRSAGTGWDGTIFYSTSGHGFSGSYFKTIPNAVTSAWSVIEWDMGSLTVGQPDWAASTITSIRIDLGNSIGDAFDIDWIAIGKYGPTTAEDFATVGAPAGTYVGSTLAQTVESNAASALSELENKLSKNADDILGGVLAVNTVSVPVGLRVGSLTWNAAGARTSGSGLGFTPQGAIAYNSIGTLTFFVNATNGDAYFAGQLAAAYGSFGAVTIAAGGSISSGQTAFNTGNGFYLSFAGGVAKFSVGNSAGAYMYYDGSVLRISGVTYDAFTLDVPDFYQSGGAGVRYFSMTATKTGGKGTVKYQWSFVSEASEPGISIQSGANSATCNFACINKTAGTSASGTAICTVIDEDGRSANDSALVEQQY